MTRIDETLLRRRSEHNDKNLTTLEEITLHQFDIEKIELIGSLCPKLKIIFFQNNLIAKIENLQRLKCLEYLNLALNNIRVIENLERCESLNKLDLTVNFVDLDTFEESIMHLQQCEFLQELFLTGNPCTQFKYYRLFVADQLPQLKKLDGQLITKTERIRGRRQLAQITEALREVAQVRRLEYEAEQRKEVEEKANGTYQPNELHHSPAARYETYLQEQKQKEQDEFEAEAQKKFGKPEDLIKKAKQKLGEWASEGPNGELPRQRNQHRLDFKIQEDDGEGNIRVLIKCPKFIDTNLIEVNCHPLWFQAIIKGQSLLLHLPGEVKSDKSRVRRVLSTGWVEIICPRVYPLPKKTRKPKKVAVEPTIATEEKEREEFSILDTEPFFDDPEVPPLC